MLKITAQDGAGTIRLKLEGALRGIWVPELEKLWRRSACPGGKSLIIDLTDVEYIDMAGRYLLAWMHANGAGFVADTPLMRDLIEGITSGDASSK